MRPRLGGRLHICKTVSALAQVHNSLPPPTHTRPQQTFNFFTLLLFPLQRRVLRYSSSLSYPRGVVANVGQQDQIRACLSVDRCKTCFLQQKGGQATVKGGRVSSTVLPQSAFLPSPYPEYLLICACTDFEQSDLATIPALIIQRRHFPVPVDFNESFDRLMSRPEADKSTMPDGYTPLTTDTTHTTTNVSGSAHTTITSPPAVSDYFLKKSVDEPSPSSPAHSPEDTGIIRCTQSTGK
jgi:hypothetical protein